LPSITYCNAINTLNTRPAGGVLRRQRSLDQGSTQRQQLWHLTWLFRILISGCSQQPGQEIQFCPFRYKEKYDAGPGRKKLEKPISEKNNVFKPLGRTNNDEHGGPLVRVCILLPSHLCCSGDIYPLRTECRGYRSVSPGFIPRSGSQHPLLCVSF